MNIKFDRFAYVLIQIVYTYENNVYPPEVVRRGSEREITSSE